MAKNIVTSSGMPIDQPLDYKPGAMYEEDNCSGNAKHLALPPEAPERANKGDLGNSVIPGFEPKSSFESPGLPFKNLKE